MTHAENEPANLSPAGSTVGRFQRGIPAAELMGLVPYWERFPGLKDSLFIELSDWVSPPSGDLHPPYFETHFIADQIWHDVPDAFAILTAWATTGQHWSYEKNVSANERLRQDLRQLGVWFERLVGYSPISGHEEPGWAVALNPEIACRIGLRYLQDAIYLVHEGDLWVGRCADGDFVRVGPFWQRLHRSKVMFLPRPGHFGLIPEKADLQNVIDRHFGCVADGEDPWRRQLIRSVAELAERYEVPSPAIASFSGGH